MDLDDRFPALSDLRDRARRRISHYLWEYLDNATGDEGARVRAEAALNAVTLMPSVLHGDIEPVLDTPFLGRSLAAPIAGEFLGDMGWFQLYAPTDPGLRRDVLARAKDAGFHTRDHRRAGPADVERGEARGHQGSHAAHALGPAAKRRMPGPAMGMLGRPMPRPRLSTSTKAR